MVGTRPHPHHTAVCSPSIAVEAESTGEVLKLDCTCFGQRSLNGATWSGASAARRYALLVPIGTLGSTDERFAASLYGKCVEGILQKVFHRESSAAATAYFNLFDRLARTTPAKVVVVANFFVIPRDDQIGPLVVDPKDAGSAGRTQLLVLRGYRHEQWADE